MFVKIFHNDNSQLTENFSASEVYDASHPVGSNDWIEMDMVVINIAQYIREQVGSLNVNSAFRNRQYNAIIGGSSNSQHIQGRALDLSGSNVVYWMSKQIEDNSQHLEIMKRMGLRGVGLYDWGIHIDTKMIEFRKWDKRSKKKV